MKKPTIESIEVKIEKLEQRYKDVQEYGGYFHPELDVIERKISALESKLNKLKNNESNRIKNK